ncbi:hypothetical protein SPRG_17158 [Saprolegnia parasitica CBS 223.65]|uniref:Cysteine/serine-rich nuclear protein N-terminal domain-containing protein n=1 Tax=Saprolegnia parasitica (strain CBS 223.65) TaxID=695850 RepID=A0A067BG78_SAPPC|nr:hypothetical protein SPRG_17158 [Saprolegnia parasitica CBS 223.65]KDO17409.1 hypothetical protein SPRG_17158 [Saprolegnia parasitica CBS 223.65]|eukprot:XP_012211886.1 hypothetical protein SPRG_17158 [Saprolegnia parasitica CBS 223.65]
MLQRKQGESTGTKKRPRSSDGPSTPKRAKTVHFSSATVYEFRRAHGGSSVPSEDGPPLGMAYVHQRVQCVDIASTETAPRRINRYSSAERRAIFKKLSYPSRLVEDFSADAAHIRASRRATTCELRLERKRAVDDEPDRL